MKKIPFCRECIYYGGRKHGKGTCNIYGTAIVAEHIKEDFWCVKGKYTREAFREQQELDKYLSRCAYNP